MKSYKAVGWVAPLVTALALTALAVFWPRAAAAAETVLDYELPDTMCDGSALVRSDIVALEIYISAAPIAASDVECPTDLSDLDNPPENFSELIQTGALTGSSSIDLFPGPYFARGRVQHANGTWSNFSPQASITVPGRAQPPLILRWDLGG